MTTAMVLSGLIFGLVGALGAAGMTTEAVLGGAFLALAVGVVLPRRLALWVCTKAWRRFVVQGREGSLSNWFVSGERPDRPLYWIVLSFVALLVGVAAVVLPLLIRVAGAAFAQLDAHFVWSAIPLQSLHLLIAFSTALIPLGALGFAISCVHHLSCPLGRWESRATGWLLVGACAGVPLAEAVSRHGAAVPMLFLSAALPALLLSVIAGGVGAYDRSAPTDATDATTQLPMWSDRRPRLTRACIVVVGSGAACALLTWACVFGEADGVRFTMTLMLLSLAVGYALGCRMERSGAYSLGSFGLVCAVTGTVVAAASAFVAIAVGGNWGGVAVACASLAPIGFTTGFGRKLLLTRVGSRSMEGAKTTARLLVGTALTCWLAVPLAIHLVGASATLMLLAISLIALGGILISRS